MPIKGGKDAQFIFAGQTIGAAQCLADSGYSDNIERVIYQCSGLDKTAPGTRQVTFDASFALSATAVVLLNAIDPGTTGTFLYQPSGTTATYTKVTASKATSLSCNISSPVNGVITCDLSIGLDDIVISST